MDFGLLFTYERSVNRLKIVDALVGMLTQRLQSENLYGNVFGMAGGMGKKQRAQLTEKIARMTVD